MYFTVVECDQGVRNELLSFSTKAEASDYIANIYTDMARNPSYYYHLANPCYAIVKESD